MKKKEYPVYSKEQWSGEKKKHWHFVGFMTKNQWKKEIPKEWKREGTVKLGKVL